MSTREVYRPKDYARAAAEIIALLPQNERWRYTTSLASCKRKSHGH